MSIWSFIKRYKGLSILFVLSLYCLIRDSDIPFLIQPSPMVDFFFSKPKDPFFHPLLNFINLFTSAYSTGLIFYYLVEYLPKYHYEKSAISSFHCDFDALVSKINRLLSCIDFMHIDSDADNISFYIVDSIIYCKDDANKIIEYNPYSESCELSRSIINQCKHIRDEPVFSFLSPNLSFLLSSIYNHEIINNLCFNYLPHNVFKDGFSYHLSTKNYQNLQHLMNSFVNFDIVIPSRIRYHQMTPSEVSDYKNHRIAVLREIASKYPQLSDTISQTINNYL